MWARADCRTPFPNPSRTAHRGGRIDLRKVLSDEPGMSPLEIWCNEAQERYVLLIGADQLQRFAELCARERCPYAVVGDITDDGWLKVSDPLLHAPPVDVPLDVILGKPPRMTRDVRRLPALGDDFSRGSTIEIRDAAYRLLRLPAVADKTFLISIGDRSVGGLISRDPFVGPWQVPVSDVAVTLSDYTSTSGEAMAMGERTPLALLDAPASGRMAVAEAITNIAAADIAKISDVRLSANWMAACGEPGEDADLYATVNAVGEEFCPGARHHDSGRQGFAVDEDELERSRAAAQDGGAAVADHFGVRAGAGCAQDADAAVAHRPRRDAAAADRSRRVARIVSAVPALRRCTASSGHDAPDCEDPQLLGRFFAAIAELRAPA